MKFSPAFVCPVLYRIYSVWCSTLRYREDGRQAVDVLWQKKIPMVFALWHDELFPLMHVKRSLEIVTVVSQSRDGEYLAGVLTRLGLYTARGSSSRGGVNALLQSAKMMRKYGLAACITVDGPRGPRHQAKEGAIFLAQHISAYIVPVRIHMSRAKVLTKSWDKFQIPLPFSKIQITYGLPYQPTATSDANKGLAPDETTILQNKLMALGT